MSTSRRLSRQVPFVTRGAGPSLPLGVLIVLSVTAGVGAGESPFATVVIEYAPAPGQFVNTPEFDDPTVALGPPSGGGTHAPSNESIVTLGGFGGFVVLGFDHRVMDDPRNAYGMDAIVYGNAHWQSGSPQRRFAECVTIEISLDANGNGIADDAWYLIPGSHITDLDGQFLEVLWDDNVNDASYPPADADWIPPGAHGVWSTSGYALPTAIFGATVLVNPSPDPTIEGVFGYADSSPTLVLGDLDADNVVDDAAMTPEEFYTWPDDPRAVGMSPGAGGGDAFDIAWAVDPETGEPANLPGFDFIRLTTAVNFVLPPFGEKSGEIDAVADVRPDPWGDVDRDDDIDLWDVAVLQTCFGEVPLGDECQVVDLGDDHVVERLDATALLFRMTGP